MQPMETCATAVAGPFEAPHPQQLGNFETCAWLRIDVYGALDQTVALRLMMYGALDQTVALRVQVTSVASMGGGGRCIRHSLCT